jgi:hypothetical protein
MALPQTRQQFRETCLRRLGAPVVPIALDDDQIEDIIDYCLSYYHDYHYDGSEKQYYKHKLTDTDKSNGFVIIPENIIGVTRIIDSSGFIGAADSLYDVKYQIALNDLFNLTSVSIVPYYLAMRHLEVINQLFSVAPQIRYNRHTNKLYLDLNWSSTKVGSYIVLECYSVVDPNQFKDVWKDRWLLEYTTAQLKKQWASHLKLYNITLLGGATYNGQGMYEEAIRDIERLEDDMIHSYSLPISDMIGPSF